MVSFLFLFTFSSTHFLRSVNAFTYMHSPFRLQCSYTFLFFWFTCFHFVYIYWLRFIRLLTRKYPLSYHHMSDQRMSVLLFLWLIYMLRSPGIAINSVLSLRLLRYPYTRGRRADASSDSQCTWRRDHYWPWATSRQPPLSPVATRWWFSKFLLSYIHFIIHSQIVVKHQYFTGISEMLSGCGRVHSACPL